MKYQTKVREVEAYEYTGDPENPGWPDGWMPPGATKVLSLAINTIVVKDDGRMLAFHRGEFERRYEEVPA